MEADGQVYYVTPSQVVKADHAVYTAADTTIVMTGDVVAAQGKNVIAGSRLMINTNTGVATMETGRDRPRGQGPGARRALSQQRRRRRTRRPGRADSAAAAAPSADLIAGLRDVPNPQPSVRRGADRLRASS